MSKENAQKFLDDVKTNEGLKKTLLSDAANAQAWITSAATAGYQINVDELRGAAEAVTGKPVTTEQLIGTLRGLVDGELNDGSLDAVTGGAKVPEIRQVAPVAHVEPAALNAHLQPQLAPKINKGALRW
jgi:hypothetical protein